MTIGAVVISRNDGYGGAQPEKTVYVLSALLHACNQVIFVDWNSPNDETLFSRIKDQLPRTGKLRVIQVTQEMHNLFTGGNPQAQKCVESMARNIGIRRIGTDWIISTNCDVMILDRESIVDGIIDDKTFHCIARRDCDFPEIQSYGTGAKLRAAMRSRVPLYPQYGDGSPLGTSDPWSLINCPGDFQMAHRDVWNLIRGFEEYMFYRGYTDSNVQRKADWCGYKLALVRDIPAFHFRHYTDTGSCGGGVGPMNDRWLALEGYTGTRNTDSWGFSQLALKETIL